MATDFKNMSTSKRMGLGFTGALAAAGVLFYLAKRNVSSKRKADLGEYRTALQKSERGSTPAENTRSRS